MKMKMLSDRFKIENLKNTEILSFAVISDEFYHSLERLKKIKC